MSTKNKRSWILLIFSYKNIYSSTYMYNIIKQGLKEKFENLFLPVISSDDRELNILMQMGSISLLDFTEYKVQQNDPLTINEI